MCEPPVCFLTKWIGMEWQLLQNQQHFKYYISLCQEDKILVSFTLLPWDVLMEIPTEEHCNEYFEPLSVTLQLKFFKLYWLGMVTVESFEWGQSEKKIRLYNTLKQSAGTTSV